MAFRTHTTKNGTVITLTIDVKKSAFVFSGSSVGEHYLDLSSTDEHRLNAHWDGYVETASKYDGSTGQLRDASRVLPFTTDEG